MRFFRLFTLYLTLGVLGGCNFGHSNSGTVRQNELTMSQSPDFPYSHDHVNKYYVALSNHGDAELQLTNSNLEGASLASVRNISQLVDSNVCKVIAPHSNCLLPITLPSTTEKKGFFNFKLDYVDNKTNKHYPVTKLITFADDIAPQDGIRVTTRNMENIVENAKRFTLVLPFSLETKYQDVAIKVNGQIILGQKSLRQAGLSNKSKDYNSLHCSNGFNAGSSCSAIIELASKNEKPKVEIITTDLGGQTHSRSIDFSVQYGNQAHLIYLNTPLILNLDNPRGEITVFNTGTAQATDLSIDALNSSSIVDIKRDSTTCSDTLVNGSDCKILYKISATIDSDSDAQTGTIEQQITYNHSQDQNITDSLKLYRTLGTSSGPLRIISLTIDGRKITSAEMISTNLISGAIASGRPQINVIFNREISGDVNWDEFKLLDIINQNLEIPVKKQKIGPKSYMLAPLIPLDNKKKYSLIMDGKLDNQASTTKLIDMNFNVNDLTDKGFVYLIKRNQLTSLTSADNAPISAPNGGDRGIQLIRCAVDNTSDGNVPFTGANFKPGENFNCHEASAQKNIQDELNADGGALKVRVYGDYLYITRFSSVLRCKLFHNGSIGSCDVIDFAAPTTMQGIQGIAFYKHWVYLSSYANRTIYKCSVNQDGMFDSCSAGVANGETDQKYRIAGIEINPIASKLYVTNFDTGTSSIKDLIGIYDVNATDGALGAYSRSDKLGLYDVLYAPNDATNIKRTTLAHQIIPSIKYSNEVLYIGLDNYIAACVADGSGELDSCITVNASEPYMVIQPVKDMVYAFSRYSNLLNVLMSSKLWLNSNINVLSSFGVLASEDDSKPHLVLAMDYYKPIITPNPVLAPSNIVIADEYVSDFTYNGLSQPYWKTHFTFKNNGPSAATNIKLKYSGIIAPSGGRIVDTCSSLPRNALKVNQSCEISGLQSMTASQVSVILTSDEGNHVESTTHVDHYTLINQPTSTLAAPVRVLPPLIIDQLNTEPLNIKCVKIQDDNCVGSPQQWELNMKPLNKLGGIKKLPDYTFETSGFSYVVIIAPTQGINEVIGGLGSGDPSYSTLSIPLNNPFNQKITISAVAIRNSSNCGGYVQGLGRNIACGSGPSNDQYYFWVNQEQNKTLAPGTYKGKINLTHAFRSNTFSSDNIKLRLPITIPIEVIVPAPTP